MQPIKF